MKIRKADLFLLLLIIVIGGIFLLIRTVKEQTDSNRVEISVEGKVIGVYNLDQNKEITIGDGTNKLKIENSVADMVWADCPDKLCVHQAPISANGQTIICLPNQVVVTVISGDDNVIDGISK